MSVYFTTLHQPAIFTYTDENTGRPVEYIRQAGASVLARTENVDAMCNPTLHGGGFNARYVVDPETGSRSGRTVVATQPDQIRAG